MVVDRIIPTFTRIGNEGDRKTDVPGDKEIFIPSIEEQSILMNELVFLFATSVIQNVPQMKAEFLSIYPVHLHHRYTAQAGEKTKQYPLGLFDTNETKTGTCNQDTSHSKMMKLWNLYFLVVTD